MTNQRVSDSFVAISDFHAMEWPLEKVKDYYLNEYEKIFILGDATDRGENGEGKNGIKLLQQIKQLSEKYPGRVIYIPGNHDEFVLSYGRYQNDYAIRNLSYNHGNETMDDFDKLRRENPQELERLMDWLGKQPLQRVHCFEGKKFVFAHAFFNQTFFDEDSKFNLDKLHQTKDKKKRQLGDQILWFRATDDYNIKDVPRKYRPSEKIIEVVGHTPLFSRRGQDLSLRNLFGEKINVVCVDGGIAYNGTMLKFDGKNDALITVRAYHDDTSPKVPTPIVDQPKLATPNTAPIKSQDEKTERIKKVVNNVIIQETASSNSSWTRNGVVALLENKIGWINFFNKKNKTIILESNFPTKDFQKCIRESVGASTWEDSEIVAQKYLSQLYEENPFFQQMVDIDTEKYPSRSFRSPMDRKIRKIIKSGRRTV